MPELDGETVERFRAIAIRLREVIDIDFYLEIQEKAVDDIYNASVGFSSNNCIFITYDMADIMVDSELAAVIAHEIGHLENKDRRKLGLILQFLSSPIICLLIYKCPPMNRSVRNILHTNEFRADARAVEILKKSNFDPLNLVVALYKLLLYKDLSDSDTIEHPAITKRITRILKLISEQ